MNKIKFEEISGLFFLLNGFRGSYNHGTNIDIKLYFKPIINIYYWWFLLNIWLHAKPPRFAITPEIPLKKKGSTADHQSLRQPSLRI